MSVQTHKQDYEADQIEARDVISPKLFTAALEDVFKLLDWNGLGININGEYITQLRFAEDVVIMAETLGDLNTMLNYLRRVSQPTVWAYI
ncbi:jg18443 [Pararge aegeria aegeria]|uniref:Jg18443 protein n=1 Tax=Pararge aegeria aegeria TaxID=348720 RepID=A0A8S4SGX7_9NEOP|nr:jg18443 [Pararge aegeria aegeria]